MQRPAALGKGALFLTAFLATFATFRGLWADIENERSLAIYNIHTKEEVSVVYKRRGQYVPSGLKKLNWAMRDWRQNKPTKMDPKLLDILWEVHTELGSKEPIHLFSGYRSQKTNNMLRKTRGGQARKSQHILGRAADVHFPDVPVKRLRYSALVREQGGVGYYPTSAIPFVHLDTGRVRHWPRMKRHELALLFPSGRSKHRPSGGALRKRDVTAARKKYASLAKRIAAFQRDRAAARSRLRGQEPTLFAAARGVPGASTATRVAAAPVPSRVDGDRAAGSWATASTVTAAGGNGPAPSSGEGSPSGAGAASLLASAADLLNARTWQVPAPALAINGAVAALAPSQPAGRPVGAAPTGTASNDGTAPATGAAGTWVVARAQAPSRNGPALAAGTSPNGTGARASIAEVADLLNGPGLSAQRGGVRAPLPRQVTAAA
ncbi:MAG: DUF882 domain-containing protein, partial [Pseudomonadota bacterium]